MKVPSARLLSIAASNDPAPRPESGALIAAGAIDEAVVRYFMRASLWWQPDRAVFPPPWIGHIPFAFWLTEAVRPKIFVELGSHTGNSYCAFLQAVRAFNLPTACYAVDTWRGDEHTGPYGDEVFQELSSYTASHYGFSSLCRMTFDDALPCFSDGSIDLLHLDGLHGYDAVVRDFRLWLPKMSRRGVIVLHDIAVRDRDFGVYRLWEEIQAQYPSFAFLHSHGLGIVAVGNEPMPPSLAWLLNRAGKEPALAADVRFICETLGQRLVDRFWAEQRRKDLAVAEDRIASLSSDLVTAEQVKRELDSLRQSTTWKVMHPVRQVLRHMPGLTTAGRLMAQVVWWTVTGQLRRKLRERRAATPAPPQLDAQNKN